MCRLLGWVARKPTTLAALLGQQDLFDFTELSGKHGDGWGIAWATGDAVQVVKYPEAARCSDAFATTAHTQASDVGVIHLRWATLGLEVNDRNTHPFTDGQVALAHNGSIRPPESLDSLLSDDARRRLRGTTDSERYFLAVLNRLRSAPPGDALAATASEIAAIGNYTSLNCLLITPDSLHALCRYDPARRDEEEEADYFDILYRVSDSSVIVASTGWGSGWQRVGNGELLTVSRYSLHVSVRSLTDVEVGS